MSTLLSDVLGGVRAHAVEFTASGIFDPAAYQLRIGAVIHVLAISAGGGGGKGGAGYGVGALARAGGKGGGGGGGMLVERFIVLRDLTPIVLTVGASAAQQAGGATSFGTHFSLVGGKSGGSGVDAPYSGSESGRGGAGGASANGRSGESMPVGSSTGGRGAGAAADLPVTGDINGYCQGGRGDGSLTPPDFGCGGHGGVGGIGTGVAGAPGVPGGQGFVRVMYWR